MTEIDDLSALVRRLAQALCKASPDNDLPAKALDYLQRKGLQGSPLRSAPKPSDDVAKDALVKALKDLRWRIDDTADQLQATDYAGNRRYGLDEWSGPILNLKRAIDVIDAAMAGVGNE